MPYTVSKLKDGFYRVTRRGAAMIASNHPRVTAKHTTKTKAQAQVKLLKKLGNK